jgi:hypothetical protein
MDDMDMDDIDMDEQFDIDNPNYICEHWYNILEQSYNLAIDLDADVGYESDEDVMDDVMVDLAIFEMEIKLLGMQLEVRDLERGLKRKRRRGIPQRTSGLKRPMWVQWVLHNLNPNTCYEQFRMWPATFIALSNTLQQNEFLRNTRSVKVTEQLIAFCLVMAHSYSARSVADRLQRSTYFVNVYVRQSARALCQLGKSIIQPNLIVLPHLNVANNELCYLWFAVSYQTILFYDCEQFSVCVYVCILFLKHIILTI